MYQAHRESNAHELLGKAITRISMVYITATVGLALLKTEILTCLADEEYLGAIPVIVPIASAYFFMVLANLMDAALWLTRRTARKPYIAAASATLMAVLYYTLIAAYRPTGHAEIGAAYATLLGLMAHAVFTYIATRNVYTIKFEFGRLLIAGGIAAACCYVGNLFGDGFGIGTLQNVRLRSLACYHLVHPTFVRRKNACDATVGRIPPAMVATPVSVPFIRGGFAYSGCHKCPHNYPGRVRTSWSSGIHRVTLCSNANRMSSVVLDRFNFSRIRPR